MVYPANWFTVTTPANLACRYFDPAPITVPTDPTTLVTAIQVTVDPATTYDAALAAATNPTAWNVLVNEPATAAGLAGEQDRGHLDGGQPGLPGRDDALRIPAQPGHGLGLDPDQRDRRAAALHHEHAGGRPHGRPVVDQGALAGSRSYAAGASGVAVPATLGTARQPPANQSAIPHARASAAAPSMAAPSPTPTDRKPMTGG